MVGLHASPTQALEATRQTFTTATGDEASFYSLKALAEHFPNVARLPVSLRMVLESVLRHCDGRKITHAHVAQLANWQPQAERSEEIPFVVARVLLQDFTGVPLLADLAAMRSAAVRLGQDPRRIEPLVPVDLVIDHSVTVDHYGTPEALDLNMQLEFQRNQERYEFLKWGMQAFDNFAVVPPGFGIVHQVNLEYLARGVHVTRPPQGLPVYYPDSLVGTDSHTTMINGLGVVAWGVGGIEAEAAMLGQPVYFLTPDVVGVELVGRLREGVSATDLVLRVTEMLRKEKVVGQFVEYFGEGARTLAVPDRATLANMAPEYGATMGFFPVDDKTLDYLWGTGRTRDEIDTLEAYFRAQGLFGIPLAGQVHYSRVVGLNLGDVSPSVAGPRRPQDRIELGQVAQQFKALLSKPTTANGFGQSAAVLGTRHQLRHGEPAPASKAPTSPPMPADAGRHETEMDGNRPTLLAAQPQALPEAHTAQPAQDITVGHGDVLIAAITSCTNTSNPSVMLAAGLLAKKAVERGLKVAPHIKTSLAPGSRMVTDYLSRAGLLPFLEQLGFALVGYGCTTCIGNSGDLTPELNEAIMEADLVCAAVLSGNRNFEARIHPHIKANFWPARPWWWPTPLQAACSKTCKTSLWAKTRRATMCFCATSGPAARRSTRSWPWPWRESATAPLTPRLKLTQAGCGARCKAALATPTPGRPAATLPSRRFLSISRWPRRQCPRPPCTAHASWLCLATPSPPTTFRRPAPSRHLHPPASGCWPRAWPRPTSTAMARGGASTR